MSFKCGSHLVKTGPCMEDHKRKTVNWSAGSSTELGVFLRGALQGWGPSTGWAQGFPLGEHLCLWGLTKPHALPAGSSSATHCPLLWSLEEGELHL